MPIDEVDELCINTIRMLSIDAVQQAQSGHSGMPMGMLAVTGGQHETVAVRPGRVPRIVSEMPRPFRTEPPFCRSQTTCVQVCRPDSW
jgi:hypothetical protein